MQSVPSISFVTLGCAKNEVDTDKMQTRLMQAGFEIVQDTSFADLIIVNTCAFLSSAVEESLEVIFNLSQQQHDDGTKHKVLVAGCMPARYGKDLQDELVEAAGFLNAHDEDRIVEHVEQLLGISAPVQPVHSAALKQAQRSNAGPSAYVKVSDGCDRFCSYCMIPYIRGRYHSFSLEDIDNEVTGLIDSGVREIVLIGQDTGIWGTDFEEPSTTATLVSTLAERHPTTWFRLLYVQPKGITDELIDALATHDNICSYLDMPLQHADPHVVKQMNREGGADEYLALVKRIRERIPGVMCRTTYMAGFPGETDSQFDALMDFAETAEFDYAAVFPYSPEEGSAAFDFEDQVDEDERMSRAQRLLDLCETIGTGRIAECVGQEVDVLAEGYEYTDIGIEALCRTQGQAPEVDGQVHVPLTSEEDLKPGQFARVRLTGSFYYELEGELLSS